MAGLRGLNGSQRKNGLKAILKVSLCKNKLLREGIRVDYTLICTETTMKSVVIAARADGEARERCIREVAGNIVSFLAGERRNRVELG